MSLPRCEHCNRLTSAPCDRCDCCADCCLCSSRQRAELEDELAEEQLEDLSDMESDQYFWERHTP